jgi:hypothetical protein
MATVKCAKCGGDNELDSGTKFMRCRYCESQMYIDRSGAGFFYILPYQQGFVTQDQVHAAFKRWAAGPKMAKELESQFSNYTAKAQFFPVYMFRRDVNGQEQVLINPAKSTTLPGMHMLKVPAGDIKVFDQKYNYGGTELVQPDIGMNAYLSALPGKPTEQALVYFPIWNVTYDFRGKRYSTIIDGSTGQVFSSEFPTRAETPFLVVGIGGFAAFFAGGVVVFAVNIYAGVAVIAGSFAGILAGSYYVATKL